MPTYQPAPEAKSIADELMPLYHTHLIEHRVQVEFYFSDREVGDHAVCRYGKTHAIKNLHAFLAARDTDAQFDPLTFVCIKCLAWKPEGDRAGTEINGQDYDFCLGCRDTLNDAKVQDPDDGFLAWLAKKGDQARQKVEAGAPEGAGAAMYVIELYDKMWADATPDMRRAMIDSKLSDCWSHRNSHGDVVLTKLPCDIVEHSEVIERHGLGWRSELRSLESILRTGGQVSLKIISSDGTTALVTPDTETAIGGGRSRRRELKEAA